MYPLTTIASDLHEDADRHRTRRHSLSSQVLGLTQPPPPKAYQHQSRIADLPSNPSANRMAKMTLLSRVSDGLPLAASMEDEKDHRELDAYKTQAKKIVKTLTTASPGRMTIESGGSFFQCADPCHSAHG